MKIKVAIIGLGPHGMRFVQCVLNDERLWLVAVVDKDSSKLNSQSIPKETAKCKDISEIWSFQISVLLIATNGPSHAPIAFEAIEKGVKYILVTKPIATTLKDARSLQALSALHDVRIAVDHGLRYDTTYQWIKRSIKEGMLGKIRSIYIQRPGIGLGCLGVHSFDLATNLINDTIDTVTGWVDSPLGKNPRGEQFIDPGGLVVISYKNGAKAIISQIEDGIGPMSVEINFTKARIRVDEKFNLLEWVYSEAPPLRGFVRVVNPHDQPVSHNTIKLMNEVINELVFESSLEADVRWGVLSFEVLLAAYMSSEDNHMPIKLPITDHNMEARFLPVT